MYQEQVARHYQQRGYRTTTAARLRGDSGAEYACGMLVEGPLGNLVVEFPPADEAYLEFATLKAKAQDLGASGVLAVPALAPAIKQAAVRHGLVVLEEQDLGGDVEVEEREEWPAERAPPQRDGAWPQIRKSRPAPPAAPVGKRFGWLSAGRAPTLVEPDGPIPDPPAPATAAAETDAQIADAQIADAQIADEIPAPTDAPAAATPAADPEPSVPPIEATEDLLSRLRGEMPPSERWVRPSQRRDPALDADASAPAETPGPPPGGPGNNPGTGDKTGRSRLPPLAAIGLGGAVAGCVMFLLVILFL